MNLLDLRKPFPADRISWRVGSTNADKTKGLALAYIDARDVQDRLDEVCGIAGWQSRIVPMHDKKTVCEIGIFCEGRQEWIWKADGAGDSDVEAEKGALSDAFKRAAVKWGVGRYLYDLDSPWVKLEAAGRSFKIAADEYPRLRKLLEGSSERSTAVTPKDEPGKKSPVIAWVAQAEADLAKVRSREDMAAFAKIKAAGLDKLRTTDPALYNALNLKIALRNDELEAVAAA